MNLIEILSKVGFDWRLALLNLVNFLIIFFLLKKFLFTSIGKKLDERKKMIEKGVEDAKKAKTELQMAEQRAQELIDEAKVAANKLLEQAHDQAKQTGDDMKRKAKEEIELLVMQAKKNIDIDKETMRQELKQETVALVLLVAEKILSQKLDSKKDDAYIKDILATLK
ncbi:MAG: F0F1 ATP synthase subunit B [Candidatus Magasanikbacteria bacterium]|jgi:F-type H+-transporting ATPase subunit b|nr:F0F1 ATP synthase subunit B [Candidatus Magasanikbacteria bacterium]